MSVLATSCTALESHEISLEKRQQLWLTISTCVAISSTLALSIYGFDYYRMDQAGRVLSPKHALLKPSGVIGIRLGIFGVLLFLLIYLYAIRKRWKWLSRMGQTKHWLDFHVVMGIFAPVVITFHASFKFHGIAGIAYWIMVAVALSGLIGRYIYAQIPRRLGAAEISLKELRELSDRLSQQLHAQKVLSMSDLAPLFDLPSATAVQSMSSFRALWIGICYDLARPWRTWRIRRRAMRSYGHSGQLLRSRRAELERVIASAGQQASVTKKIVLLSKTHELLQLWHVIHRPFSYSFVILAVIHIAVVLMIGYY